MCLLFVLNRAVHLRLNFLIDLSILIELFAVPNSYFARLVWFYIALSCNMLIVFSNTCC